MDGHRRDGDGRDERRGAVQPFLVGGVIEEVTAARADDDGRENAPVNGLGEVGAPAPAQVREADGDDQKGFESLAEGDDERLQHVDASWN